MPQTPAPVYRGNAPDLADYPALAGLNITAEELKLLQRQGFVSREHRGAKVRYKLRFRSAGRQVVRYIGDAIRANEVAAELEALQAETHLVRKLRSSVSLARRELREAKQRLEPVLNEQGLVFHGLVVRRPRL